MKGMELMACSIVREGDFLMMIYLIFVYFVFMAIYERILMIIVNYKSLDIIPICTKKCQTAY